MVLALGQHYAVRGATPVKRRFDASMGEFVDAVTSGALFINTPEINNASDPTTTSVKATED
jgi:hypothetical protein